jgi:hypothetical protein
MSTQESLTRDQAIKRIKAALKRRSGKEWSVRGGKGTAYGWITIDAPPKRRTWKYVQTTTPEPPAEGAVYCGVPGVTPPQYVDPMAPDRFTSPQDDPWAREAIERGRELIYAWTVNSPGCEFGQMGPDDRVELTKLLGLTRAVHVQGQSIPSGGDYRQEYLDRAEGREPTAYGERYWD